MPHTPLGKCSTTELYPHILPSSPSTHTHPAPANSLNLVSFLPGWTGQSKLRDGPREQRCLSFTCGRTWQPTAKSEAAEMEGGVRNPPLIHKTCHAKSFHAPASEHCSRKVHLFISLKDVYGEESSPGENKLLGETLLPFVGYLFLWES